MSNLVRICTELLELIDEKDKIIVRQSELISNILNENLEKENMINVLRQEEDYLY
mgnify:CR=1 FL=1